MTKKEQAFRSFVATNPITAEGTGSSWALHEIDRLRFRLNHQTEDDIEECRQGKHEDCGKQPNA